MELTPEFATFLKSWECESDSVCSELPIAWLEHKGMKRCPTKEIQRAEWARVSSGDVSFARSLKKIISRIGVKAMAARFAHEGDVVVAEVGTETLFGVVVKGDVVMCSAGGHYLISKARIRMCFKPWA